MVQNALYMPIVSLKVVSKRKRAADIVLLKNVSFKAGDMIVRER
jgi:hypothetical protein